MSEADKPNKKKICEDLLAGPWVFVHLDPRREGVIVPQWFKNQPQLVLQLGLNMAIPIPDLELGDEAITCTLSFSRQRHFCRLPWSAIYALLGDDARGTVWPEDVPPEVAAQSPARKQAPAPAPAPKLSPGESTKPKITALPTKSVPRAVETAASSTDEVAPNASKAGAKKAEAKGKKGKKGKDDPKTPAPEPLAAERADETTTEEIAETPPRKPKRELPPYLRVIK